jgi:UDP-sulfoquinovose synthase
MRRNVASIGSISAIPIQKMKKRISIFKALYNKQIVFYEGDLLHYDFLKDVVYKILPHCIVHLGEQPSTAFSMIDRQHATYTQHNNIEGTLNVLFAIKLSRLYWVLTLILSLDI